MKYEQKWSTGELNETSFQQINGLGNGLKSLIFVSTLEFNENP